jgi:SAM-dependent methyltransferase
MEREKFEQLVAAAGGANFSGWDFSYLEGRWIEDDPTWDYGQKVRDRLASVDTLLDMGTGGGERLAGLQPLPEHTYATEGWGPNVPVARARLEPLGVRVVEVDTDDGLPFGDDSFDMVINRHESFVAKEVWRVLKVGGRFVTQQVGGKIHLRLNELLQDQVSYPYADWVLEKAVGQLEACGFEVLEQREEYPKTVFKDIGAIVYLLKAVPWQIPGFSVAVYRDRLWGVHRLIEGKGGLVVHSHLFYVEARKV